MLLTILVVLLTICLCGGSYGAASNNPGLAWPGGLLGVVLLILLVLALAGRI